MAWTPDTLTLIDELITDTGVVNLQQSKMINRDGDVWVIMGKDAVTTVECTSAGVITDPVLDQWKGMGTFKRGDFLHLGSGNYYAFWYTGAGSDGYVSTLSIATTGGISPKSWKDDWEHDVHRGWDQWAININGDIYAVVYSGYATDGWMKTMDIDSSGNITTSAVDSLEFDTDNCNHPVIIHVSGDIYALVYGNFSDDDYILKTFDIDSSGNITATPEDTWAFYDGSAMSTGSESLIYNVSGTTYVIAYMLDNEDIKIFTLTIANDGTITKSEIDSETFTGKYDYLNAMVMAPLIDDYWAIFYFDTSDDLRVRTMNIASNGTITEMTSGALIDTCSNPTYPGLNVVELGRSADTVYFALTYYNSYAGKDVILKTISYSSAAGWQGTVNGVSNPAAVQGVLAENIQSVIGVESG